MACTGDESAGGLQSMTSLSRDTLQVRLPDSVLAADSVLNVLPASLLQRMRKRRCFADRDLERSTLLNEHALLAHTAAVNHSVAPPHSVFITSTPPCYAVTVPRDTTAGPTTYDHHDVKATSSNLTAGCHVTLQCKESPPIRRQLVANDQLERHDVTKLSSAWRSSSSRCVTMTSSTSATEQRVVKLSSTCSSSSTSSSSLSSSSSLLPKTTRSFSVESLLAM